MRAYTVRLLLAILAMWLLAVSAQAGEVITPRKPLLWQVSSKTTTIYLFGTIHVGRSEFYPLPEHVERALARSKTLVVEAKADARAARVSAEAGRYVAPDSLDQHISRSLLDELDAVLPTHDLSRENAYRMRPWFLGVTLTLIELAKRDFDQGLAVDAYLVDFANREGKPISALESVESQMAVFQSFSAEEQEAILQGSLKQIKQGRVKALMEEIVAAWGAGDAKRCERAFAASYADLPLAAQIQAKLIEERNLAFAGKIEELLRGSEPHFIAVGTGHLLGKKGIVALLKRRGYRAKQR